MQGTNGGKLESHSLCSVAIDNWFYVFPFCISVTWMFKVILLYSLIVWYTHTHIRWVYITTSYPVSSFPNPFSTEILLPTFISFVWERETHRIEFKQGCMHGHGWGDLLEHGHLNQLYHRRKWYSYPPSPPPPTHKQSPFTVSSLWALLDGMVMGSVLCR